MFFHLVTIFVPPDLPMYLHLQVLFHIGPPSIVYTAIEFAQTFTAQGNYCTKHSVCVCCVYMCAHISSSTAVAGFIDTTVTFPESPKLQQVAVRVLKGTIPFLRGTVTVVPGTAGTVCQ